VQLAEWCGLGHIKALATKQWFVDFYAERAVKLTSVMGGDLNIDSQPSSKEKPYTFYELMQE